MKQIPAVFATAQATLKNPPTIWTEIALMQAQGTRGLYAETLPKAFESVKDAALQEAFKQEQAARVGRFTAQLPFILSFVAELVMAFALYGILVHMGRFTLRAGIISGALCWLGPAEYLHDVVAPNIEAGAASAARTAPPLVAELPCALTTSRDEVHEMDLDIWNRTVALNLLHPFLSCRHGIPHLMNAGGGSIINVTSHLGLMGSIKPAYAATKGGIISFTKTLAAQYVKHGIRANAIAPGSIRTERQIRRYENPEWAQGAASAAARERNAAHKLYPFSRGEPEDIAAIALFLATDDSRMLTGTTIAADGGRSSYLRFYVEEE